MTTRQKATPENATREEAKATSPAAAPSALFSRRRAKRWEEEEETDVSAMIAPPVENGPALPVSKRNGIDLTGKPKAIFLIGPGGTGKTTFARWAAVKMSEAGREALLVAMDPQNRSLVTWFDGVEQPPTTDGAQSSRWMRETLAYQMEDKLTALYDLGGGNTAFSLTVEAMPDLVGALQSEGVEPVALYFVGPRPDDLAVMGQIEALGFQPSATAVILNEGRVDSTMTATEAFGRTLRNSVMKNALTRGVIPVFMPRLEQEVAAEIEGKRLTFSEARDGKTRTGSSVAPLGPFERSMTRRWLDKMDQQFAPIASWLP
ncbi:ArsA-related P-loop ATPase [Gluconobacter cerinus]|uniref:ArsA-related P-loop ATPase n=1 Tax=Gluconobacter cerinus TaxID=38307 RepID=UPI001B8CC1F6|nr:ArsA-related P-loop ATPase [Gluconobacter cerinus]MBS0984258.1 hypothetical protein [Gluconobacter cerinus]